MALVCGGRGATIGPGRYSTELYGWVLDSDSSAPALGASGQQPADEQLSFVSASSTALDFSSLPSPPGGGAGSAGDLRSLVSPRPASASTTARARQALEQSRARDWASAPQPEVVAEVERLQAFLAGVIATAVPTREDEEEDKAVTESQARGRRFDGGGEALEAEEAEEDEGWSVSRLLFG